MKRILLLALLCCFGLNSCSYILQQEKSYSKPTQKAIRKGRSIPFFKYGQKKQTKTIKLFETALKKAPQSEKGIIYFHYALYLDESYYLLGLNTPDKSASDLAFEYFQKAESLLPDSCWQKYVTNYYLGNYHYHQKLSSSKAWNAPGKAKAYFTKALNTDPAIKSQSNIQGIDQLIEIYLGQLCEADKDCDNAFLHYLKAATAESLYSNQGWLRLYGILYLSDQLANGTLNNTAFNNYLRYLENAAIANGKKHRDYQTYLDNAAENGYAPAQYEQSRVVENDLAKKKEWCLKAIEQNYIPAYNEMAFLIEFTGGDYANALSYCKQGAELGYPPAQWGLGNFYKLGRGTKIDYEQAAYWYAAAANNGYKTAEKSLANLPAYIESVQKAQNLQNVQTIIQSVSNAMNSVQSAMTKSGKSGTGFYMTPPVVNHTSGQQVPADNRIGEFWQRDYDKYARLAKKEIVNYVNSVSQDKIHDNDFSLIQDQRYRSTEELMKTFRQAMKNARKNATEQGYQIKADAESIALETEDFVSLLRRYRYN